MSVHMTFKFDDVTYRQMTENGTIAQATWRAAGKVRDDAKRNITADGTVDTGKLRQSIVAYRIRGRTGVWYEIGTPLFYGIFIHDGTRDHGPVRARRLRFQPKGSSVFVYAKRVRGIRGTKFLTRALQGLKASDFFP